MLYTTTIKREVRVLFSWKRIKSICLQKNIKTKSPSKKLDYIKLRPFKVKIVKKLLNYELKLLLKMKIYPVFYIIYFEQANNNILLKMNLIRINPNNQKIEYKVKAILDQ